MALFQQLWSRDQWSGLPVHRSILSPLMLLERSLHVFPEQTAVVDGERRQSYAELGRRVYRLASALRAHGVGRGDRVALLCRNAGEVLEAHFGVPQLGAALVPINVRLSSDEIGYILEHAGARALLLDTELAGLLAPVRERPSDLDLIALVDTASRLGASPSSVPSSVGGVAYERFLAEGSDEPFASPLDDEDETISINYTSGTTGRPKGVMVTHRGGYLNALGEIITAGLTSESVYLWTLPMFHCNGWCFPWAVTGAGATHVCLPSVEPDRVFRLIETEGVTHFCAAPTVLVTLAAHRPEYRFPRRLRILTAGAPPPPAVIERVEGMGAEIVHVYGLTEVYGPHTVCEWKRAWNELPGEERARMKARQGVGYVHAPELRIVDEQMRDVPADGATMGEVVMRGNNVMKGYYRDEAATAEAFRGGWFHSGDLGVMHPDGYIELRDRKKDIIISGGENISTIEVERVLYQHPAVLEAAVVAIPDERWGEVPKAFIALKPGARATAEEIVAFARERIARFKVPKAIEFGPLPKTSTGKIQKFKLREKEWAGQEKRIH
ncbi:MAG TPA: acyl--CoA ligase family protein [Chloroflexota bacterium]|jgi:fatty-acyl-CoA synthase|nr:acyl--CoA ligase family protein [Chloroflexota bacterium]